MAGQPFEALVRFESTADLDEVMIGLNFVHEPGVRVAGPNNSQSGLFTLKPGPGEARFRSDCLILNPGHYTVSAGIMQRGNHVLDHVPDGFSLDVRTAGELHVGLVRMDGDWECVQSEA